MKKPLNPRWLACARALGRSMDRRRSDRLRAWEFLIWHGARINEYCCEKKIPRDFFLAYPQDEYNKWIFENLKRPGWDQI